MWEVTPNSLTFSSSWTKFLCLFFFVFRQLRAGRGPCFHFFRRRFARVAVEVDAPRSSSDEPVSADLRIYIRRCQFGCWRGVITLRSSVPFLLDLLEPFAGVSLAGFLQLFFGGRELAASILHRPPEVLTSVFVSFADFAPGSFATLLETLLHSVPQGGMRGHVWVFVACLAHPHSRVSGQFFGYGYADAHRVKVLVTPRTLELA